MSRAVSYINSRSTLRVALAAVVALAAFLVAQGLELGLSVHLPPYVIFYPAIMMAALLLGPWPGAFATILAAILIGWWLLPASGQHGLAGYSDAIGLAIFVSACLVLCTVTDRYRTLLRRLAELEEKTTLHTTQVKLKLALASMTDAVFICDADGRLLECNEAFATFHRFRDKASCARTLAEFLNLLELLEAGGQTVPVAMWPLSRALRGETGSNVEHVLRRTDTGESWTGSFNFSPIRDARGQIAGAVVSARDITSQKQAAEALRVSEARYRLAFQTGFDGMTITRLEDGKYMEVNQSLLEMLGYSREEIIGHTSLERGIWSNLHDREHVFGCLRQRPAIRDVQVQFCRKNGELFWAIVSASTIEIGDELCVLSAVRDISGAKLAEEEIRDLSFFDPLTGLANRRLLMEELRKSIAENPKSNQMRALLFIDLDHFKTLNDTLGYQTGDLLLREVAHRLVGCVREGDLVGRLAGDEFVALLGGLSPVREEAAAQVKLIAEKILSKVDQPYRLNGRECISTCCIGITVFGKEAGHFNEVLQKADLAMYQAKEAGRNTMHFFAPELQAAAAARAAMEEDMRQAIREDQFVLYYQPQFEGGRLIGVEALLRWQHPRLGLLAPDKFIPLAEETRLIFPLSDWVLETACRQIAAWAECQCSSHISIAVNVTAAHMRQADFVDSVLGVVERTGAQPQKLKLELTESMLAEDIEDMIAKMTVLKERGVSFSLDDFGTGYSSLSYLKRLPLDQLKIDRSFVRDILVDRSSVAIAQTIIALCRAMEIQVIAEGVETEGQQEGLAAMGCNAYQGYLYSRPVPLEALEQMLCKIAS